MSRSILMLRDNSSVHNVMNRALTGEGGHEVTTPELAPVGGLSKLAMDRCGAALLLLLLLLAPLFRLLTLLIRRDGAVSPSATWRQRPDVSVHEVPYHGR